MIHKGRSHKSFTHSKAQARNLKTYQGDSSRTDAEQDFTERSNYVVKLRKLRDKIRECAVVHCRFIL